MAIKLLNKEANNIDLDKKMQEFLSKGGSVAADNKVKDKEEDYQIINLRLSKSILHEIDSLLSKSRDKMPRVLWIRQAIIKALDESTI